LLRTKEPGYSDVEDIKYNWEYTVYGHVSELIAYDIPPPPGKSVVTTTYVDANLYHEPGLLLTRLLTSIIPCIVLMFLSSPKSYMFGDNQSVVTSVTIPHSGLNKHYNALSYHHVCKPVAAKILGFFHIDGTNKLLMFSANMEAFHRFGLSLKLCCFGMMT